MGPLFRTALQGQIQRLHSSYLLKVLLQYRKLERRLGSQYWVIGKESRNWVIEKENRNWVIGKETGKAFQCIFHMNLGIGGANRLSKQHCCRKRLELRLDMRYPMQAVQNHY